MLKPAIFTIHMATTGANKFHRPYIEAITMCDYMVMANNVDIHMDAEHGGFIMLKIPIQYVTFEEAEEEIDNAIKD